MAFGFHLTQLDSVQRDFVFRWFFGAIQFIEKKRTFDALEGIQRRSDAQSQPLAYLDGNSDAYQHGHRYINSHPNRNLDAYHHAYTDGDFYTDHNSLADL